MATIQNSAAAANTATAVAETPVYMTTNGSDPATACAIIIYIYNV